MNESAGMEAVRYTLRKFRAYLPYMAAAVLLRYGLDAIPIFIQGDIKGAVYSLLNLPFEMSLLSSTDIMISFRFVHCDATFCMAFDPMQRFVAGMGSASADIVLREVWRECDSVSAE